MNVMANIISRDESKCNDEKESKVKFKSEFFYISF